MRINRIAVVGAGTMGASIAVALIGRGIPVLMKDVDETRINNGLATIDRLLKSRIDKGLSPAEAEAQKKIVETTTDYGKFADVDFVIEAVPEILEVKRAVLQDLDEYCNVDAIFGSNTSSLSITQLGSFTRRPDKVVGLHFFNPAHLMKLVEVIPGLETSSDTVNTAIELGQCLGKLAVRVEECASFLVNRLLGRYMNEALWCLQEGVATVEEIDKAACDFVMPIGPLALRDMNGADVGLAVARFNFQEYGDRFKPAPVLEAMVKTNLLGQKTLGGFYRYDENSRKRIGPNPALDELVASLRTTGSGKPVREGKTGARAASKTGGKGSTTDSTPASKTALATAPQSTVWRGGAKEEKRPFFVERLFLPMINEAFLALQEKICSAEDLDPALMAGLGMRKGPLTLAAEIGLENCLAKMNELNELYGERFRPAPLLKRYVWAKRTTVV